MFDKNNLEISYQSIRLSIYGCKKARILHRHFGCRLEPPGEVQIEELREEHARAIHDLYPANDMEAVEVFERLITALPAYGVFSSGELAAWMVQSYYGAMFSMQTRPEYRRKGYGIHLAKCLTKIVRSRGYIPFVVIRPENDASQSLYHKLGFKKNYQTVRAILRPHEKAVTDD